MGISTGCSPHFRVQKSNPQLGRGNSVQLIDAPYDAKLEARTTKFPYNDDMLDPPTAAGNPVRAGGPIKHVILVVHGPDPALNVRH